MAISGSGSSVRATFHSCRHALLVGPLFQFLAIGGANFLGPAQAAVSAFVAVVPVRVVLSQVPTRGAVQRGVPRAFVVEIVTILLVSLPPPMELDVWRSPRPRPSS